MHILKPDTGRISSSFLSRKEANPAFFSKIQAKLAIGQPGDKYEVEADAMADKVVNKMQRKENSKAPFFSSANGNTNVQTKCEACESEEVQRKGQELDEDPVQTKLQLPYAIQAKRGSVDSASGLEQQLKSSQGGGRSMSADTRSSMESSFGADFSDVRIHTGSKAIQMNQNLNAQAFTHGSDVYFNQGKYNPDTTSGRHLLVHELTHVVQQNSLISRACLPASSCPSHIPGSAGDFGAGEESREVGPRGRRQRMTCPRSTSTGHAGRARQLERILSSADPVLRARIHGVFIDADMSRGTGAMVTDCADWAADALPIGCDPLTISGATKPCVLVHGDLNRQAFQFNSTSNPLIGGLPREDWRIQTIQTLIHEAQHVVFDTSGRPEPSGVSGTCPRSRIFGELSELNAIMSEFPTVFRAVPASGPARSRALVRLADWFDNAITNPDESLAGTLKAMRCECDCSEVNAHVQDIFNLVSASWTAIEKTAFNTELRRAHWDGAPNELNWPL
tara:strand:- start:25187 stop:26707 length:1521 start_codon:yes stop_codon:yes gene_type:complete